MCEGRRSAITNVTCYYWACALVLWQHISFYQPISGWFWNCPRMYRIVKELAVHTGICGSILLWTLYVLEMWPDCCQMSSTSFKLRAINAGTERHVTLEIFSLENDRGLWIGTGPVNGIIHIHHKNVRSNKICHPQRWWSFWHAEPRCSCVSCPTDCQCTVLQFICAVPPLLCS
jgi:hypothetical protein